MRGFIIFLLSFSALFGSLNQNSSLNLKETKWSSGMTLLKFFEKNQVPLKTYYNMDAEDRELADEIQANSKVWILKDRDGRLAQALIEIDDDLEMHISKNRAGQYKITYLPIEYEEKEQILNLKITDADMKDTKNSVYDMIEKASGSKKLAKAFVNSFNGTNTLKGLKSGDSLVVIYSVKSRFGRFVDTQTEMKAAVVEKDGKAKYSYKYKGAFYNENSTETKIVKRNVLVKPVNGKITSRFGLRKHPILGTSRPHRGVDFAAPSGTKVYAANSGKVVVASYLGGYGHTIKIKHSDGVYTTIYGHLRGFAKGIKVGSVVKQGQLIGFVGSTGMSTGPHLHFGLYINDKAINPLDVLNRTENVKVKNERKEQYHMLASQFNSRLNLVLNDVSHKNPSAIEVFTNNIKSLVDDKL